MLSFFNSETEVDYPSFSLSLLVQKKRPLKLKHASKHIRFAVTGLEKKSELDPTGKKAANPHSLKELSKSNHCGSLLFPLMAAKPLKAEVK